MLSSPLPSLPMQHEACVRLRLSVLHGRCKLPRHHAQRSCAGDGLRRHGLGACWQRAVEEHNARGEPVRARRHWPGRLRTLWTRGSRVRGRSGAASSRCGRSHPSESCANCSWNMERVFNTILNEGMAISSRKVLLLLCLRAYSAFLATCAADISISCGLDSRRASRMPRDAVTGKGDSSWANGKAAGADGTDPVGRSTGRSAPSPRCNDTDMDELRGGAQGEEAGGRVQASSCRKARTVETVERRRAKKIAKKSRTEEGEKQSRAPKRAQVPRGWRVCEKMGEPVDGSHIIPCKVPLCSAYR